MIFHPYFAQRLGYGLAGGHMTSLEMSSEYGLYQVMAVIESYMITDASYKSERSYRILCISG